MQIGTALRARWLRDKSKYEEQPIVPTHHEHNHEHTIGKILVLKEDFYALQSYRRLSVPGEGHGQRPLWAGEGQGTPVAPTLGA